MDKKKHGPRKGCVYEDMTSTVSGTECTGLMPTPPQDEDEYEAYQELHQEGGIFEHNKRAYAPNYGNSRAQPHVFALCYHAGAYVAHKRCERHQQHIYRLSPCIEQQ